MLSKLQNIQCLNKNYFCYFSKSFIWSTIGYTCVSFTIGALAWWSPEFGLYSVQLHTNPNATIADVSYKFGIVTFVAGVIGVTLGAEIARRWRHFNMQADALVCGFGMLGGIPFVFLTLYIFDKNTNVAWVRIAIEFLIYWNNISYIINFCITGNFLIITILDKDTHKNFNLQLYFNIQIRGGSKVLQTHVQESKKKQSLLENNYKIILLRRCCIPLQLSLIHI